MQQEHGGQKDERGKTRSCLSSTCSPSSCFIRLRLSRAGSLRAAVGLIVGVVIVALFVAANVLFVPAPDAVRVGSAPLPLERAVRPALPSEGFVGSDACRRCHAQIWERYQSHPMSRSIAAGTTAAEIAAETVESFSHQTDSTARAEFTAPSAVGEKRYFVERTAEGLIHGEALTDPELGELYNQRVPIAFGIGSGHHGRSYVLQQGDCLFQSPITWYSQAQKWDLAPGYSAAQHPRFERRITGACLTCHADRVHTDRERPNHFPSPVLLSASIGCERCHGPGERHIARHDLLASGTKSDSGIEDDIVNPAELAPELRESVCWQCHLAAEERIPRYGRADGDFRPGMHFDEMWTAFVSSTAVHESGLSRAVSQVEQMQSSRCFQQSGGRFGCTSCHDPHFSPSDSDKPAFYRDKCLVCHTDPECSVPLEDRSKPPAANSCVACHLPALSVNSVPHTSLTDHRVLRRPRAEAASQTTAEPTLKRAARLQLFGRPEQRLTPADIRRARGLMLSRQAELSQSRDQADEGERQLSSIVATFFDDADVREGLGICEQILGNEEQAARHWQAALVIASQHEGALLRLAEHHFKSRELPAARDLLRRYLAVNPWQSAQSLQLAGVLGDSGDLTGAVAAAKEALRIDPSSAAAHGMLGVALERLGQPEQAKRHQVLYRKLRGR